MVYDSYTELNNQTFFIFNTSINIPYNITDFAYVDGSWKITESSYYVELVLTCEIEDSYSNVLFLYGITMGNDIRNDSLSFELIIKLDAVVTEMDTFKVNSVLSIPDTTLILISALDYGIYIYDTILRSTFFL
jgi:hypothetical protein